MERRRGRWDAGRERRHRTEGRSLKALITGARTRAGRGRETAGDGPGAALEGVNPSTLARAIGHPVVLHRHLAALGLPTPRLHGVIGRAGGWNAAADRPVTGLEAAGRFLGGLEGDLVLRASAAWDPVAVLVLRREGPAFVDAGGRRLETWEAAAEAFADPWSDLVVVQARVVTPGGAATVARITTLVGDDGRAEVLHAHPERARDLPGWGAAYDLARRAAELLMPLRRIAWDVALTADGPVLLGADGGHRPVARARRPRATPAVLSLRLRALASVSARASEAYGISRLGAARTALRLRRRNGFDIEGALGDGLLDPAMDDRERYAHIGRAMRRAAQDRLNPVSLEPFSEEKLLFHDYCAANGLPVPRVYGAVGRAGAWSRPSGRVVAGREAFAALLAEAPGDVVVKPSFGNRGEGVRVLVRTDGGFADLGGEPVDLAALHDAICTEPQAGLHLVQERLLNHPEIEEIAGSPVLQTLRLITVVRPDGSVLILSGILKLALGFADTDNFHKGATGNGYCLLSLDDGRLKDLTQVAPVGFGLRLSPTVPGTGVRVAGRRVPFFEKSCRLVRRAAHLMLPMRTLGWDVALTPGGPVILETNNWWAPFEPLSAEGWALLTGDA